MTRNTDKTSAEPNFVDLHVGVRLRARRKALDISQSDLADRVGISFQQVQKYERGANRVSASKLHQFAEYLGVPVAYFFDGLPTNEHDIEDSRERSTTEFLLTSEGQQLAAAFSKLSSQKRKGVMHLVKSILVDQQSHA